MAKDRRPVPPIERILSLLVLLILAGVAVGMFLKQGQFRREWYGSPATAVSTPAALVPEPARADAAEAGLAAYAGAEADVLTPIETYDADTLFEKINGKADLYLSHGFVELLCQRFVLPDDAEAWFEVYAYQMASGPAAFGVYSQQQRPEAQSLAFTRFGYETGDAVFICQGPYYLEIRGATLADALMPAMLAFAERFVGAVATDPDLEEMLTWLPQANRAEGSLRYYVGDAFGQAFLTDVLAARYQTDAGELLAFVTRRPNEADAAQLIEEYARALASTGARRVEAPQAPPGAIVFDFYGVVDAAAATGSYVVGTPGAGDRAAALALLQTVMTHVEGMTADGG